MTPERYRARRSAGAKAIASADGSRPYQRLTTGHGNDRLPDWKP